MSAPDASTNRSSEHLMAVAAGITLLVAVAAFVLLRLANGLEVQGQIAAQARQIVILQQEINALRETNAAHFTTNERFLYGTVATDHARWSAITPHAAHPVEPRVSRAPLLREEAEIRARLAALERWRLIVGGGDDTDTSLILPARPIASTAIGGTR